MQVGHEVRLSEFAIRKLRNQVIVARHGGEALFRVVDNLPDGRLKIAAPTGLAYPVTSTDVYEIPATDVGLILPPFRVPALQ